MCRHHLRQGLCGSLSTSRVGDSGEDHASNIGHQVVQVIPPDLFPQAVSLFQENESHWSVATVGKVHFVVYRNGGEFRPTSNRKLSGSECLLSLPPIPEW